MVAPLSQETCDRMRRLAEIHTQATIAAICRVDRNTVGRVKARGWKRGQGAPPARAMPGDYPIQRHHMTLHELARHYRTGLGCIARWEAAAGTPRQYAPRPMAHDCLPTPPDLADVIDRLGATAAAAHFGVHPNTLVRMRRTTGLPVRRRARNKKPREKWNG